MNPPTTVSAAEVIKALGITDQRLVTEAFAAVTSRDAARLLDIAAEVHERGFDLRVFCEKLVWCFRDALVLRLVGDSGRLLLTTNPEALGDVGRVSCETLQSWSETLLDGTGTLTRSPNPRLALEVLLLRLVVAEPVVPLDDILAKLERACEHIHTREPVGITPLEEAGTAASEMPERTAAPTAAPTAAEPAASEPKPHVAKKPNSPQFGMF
jgi:DNA polymerase-3 subunit gamma/tau